MPYHIYNIRNTLNTIHCIHIIMHYIRSHSTHRINTTCHTHNKYHAYLLHQCAPHIPRIHTLIPSIHTVIHTVNTYPKRYDRVRMLICSSEAVIPACSCPFADNLIGLGRFCKGPAREEFLDLTALRCQEAVHPSTLHLSMQISVLSLSDATSKAAQFASMQTTNAF